MPQFKCVFALRADAYNEIYGPAERATLCTVADEIAPLWPGSPLSYLPPNIMLTQHIARLPDPAHRRLGQVMVAELQHSIAPLQDVVT